MTTALFLISSHIHAVVALPKSSVNTGVGHVSITQPDSLTVLDAALDFHEVSAMGLQRRISVKKAIITEDIITELLEDFSMDDVTTEFANGPLLGLQHSVSVKVQRKSKEHVSESVMEEVFRDDDMFDMVSASVLGLQREAVTLEACDDDDLDSSLLGLQRSLTVQKPKAPSKVATSRSPVVKTLKSTQCAGGVRILSARS